MAQAELIAQLDSVNQALAGSGVRIEHVQARLRCADLAGPILRAIEGIDPHDLASSLDRINAELAGDDIEITAVSDERETERDRLRAEYDEREYTELCQLIADGVRPDDVKAGQVLAQALRTFDDLAADVGRLVAVKRSAESLRFRLAAMQQRSIPNA